MRRRLLLLPSEMVGGALTRTYLLDGRRTTSLHGSQAAIVASFDVGYRNTFAADGFFNHRRPPHATARIAYSFEDALCLKVAGDRNSQRPGLCSSAAKAFRLPRRPLPAFRITGIVRNSFRIVVSTNRRCTGSWPETEARTEGSL